MVKQQYKLIIFDFDGTLGDTYHWFGSTINSAAALFNFKKIEEKDIPSLREMDTRSALKFLGVSFWKLPLISTYMRFRMSRDLKNLKLFKGVEELLEELHAQGLKMAIVSSNSEYNIRGIFSKNHADLIHHYACGSSLLGKKEKFLRVAKNLGMGPGHVLCIGDECRDVHAARESGMDSGAVTWGYGGRGILEKSSPTFIFDRVEEVVGALNLSGRTLNS